MLEADRHNGWFCHAHGLRRLYIYIYIFQITPMLLDREFHICIWRGTIITLLHFFSFVYRFLKDVNKVVDYCTIIIIIIIIIIKTAFYVPYPICCILQVY